MVDIIFENVKGRKYHRLFILSSFALVQRLLLASIFNRMFVALFRQTIMSYSYIHSVLKSLKMSYLNFRTLAFSVKGEDANPMTWGYGA